MHDIAAMTAPEDVKFYRSGFQLKFLSSDAADMTLTGYGAFFNNTDSYGDTIKQGAFADTISNFKNSGQWPAMLQQHGGWGMTSDDMMPIGIWTDIQEDEKGLLVTGKLADTARGREAYGLLKMQPRPALNGLSIGYIPTDYTMNDKAKKGEPRRTLNKVDLMEISLVTFPANDKALISDVKSADIKTIRNFEKFLRDEGGFSHAEAREIARVGFKARSESRDENDGLDELAKEMNRLAGILQPTT